MPRPNIANAVDYRAVPSTIARVNRVLWIPLLVVLCGCTKPNPVVCCDSPADCSAIGVREPERPCEQGFVCVEHQCTTGNTCESDADCSAATPHCAQNGQCVECALPQHCTNAAPTCDKETNTCRKCITDTDCESEVCDADVGSCVPSASVVYASPSGAETTDCTQASPCSLDRALSLATGARNTIKLKGGTYTAGIRIDAKNVTVFAQGATINTVSDSRSFWVTNSGKLRLVGATIRNPNSSSNGIGVACERLDDATATPVVRLEGVDIEARQPIVVNVCTMTITQSRIRGREGGYVVQAYGVAAPASVTIERSVFTAGGGFVALGSATLMLTNSVVANQASTAQAFSGNGKIHVSFSTIINSPSKCSTGSNNQPPCYTGSSTGDGACFDNSIIVNLAPGAAADTITGECVANYSIIYPQATTLTGANNRIGVNPMLVDPVASDYHLSPTSPAIDAADPASTNGIDLEGTMRPQGQRPDLGAFERTF